MGFRSSLTRAAALSFWAGIAFAQGPSPSPGPDPSLESYATPQILADVGGGRRIHILCMGQGSPTVILTAGLGNWAETWHAVQPAVAQKTRVCTWDRAGFGFSSASPEPQDVGHTTADLERALKAAKIGGPYVLVGHSLGGYESLLFADRHPRDVVGMMLEDPSVPDQQRLIDEANPELEAMNKDMKAQAVTAMMRCAAPPQADPSKPGAPDPRCRTYPPRYPEALKAALKPYDVDPARFVTRASLSGNVDADATLVMNVRRNYGQLPLIILTAAMVEPLPPGLKVSPAAQAAYMAFSKTGWKRAHDQLAALSTRGQNRMVENSSHYIHLLQPQTVIDAIDEVVEQARGGGR